MPAAAPPVTVSDLAARGPAEAWATGYEQAADGPRPMLCRWDVKSARLGKMKVQFVGADIWILRSRGGDVEVLRRSAGG